jgi:hypothetical protein
MLLTYSIFHFSQCDAFSLLSCWVKEGRVILSGPYITSCTCCLNWRMITCLSTSLHLLCNLLWGTVVTWAHLMHNSAVTRVNIGCAVAETLTSHSGHLSSFPEEATWDSCWTKWHWGTSLSEYFGFALLNVIPPVLHSPSSGAWTIGLFVA